MVARLLSALVAPLLVTGVVAAFDAVSTDEAWRAKLATFYKAYEGLPEHPTPADLEALKSTLAASATALLEGVDLGALDAEDRRTLMPLIQASETHRAALTTQLLAKAGHADLAGFLASTELIDLSGQDAPLRTTRTLAALDHPAAVEALRTGQGVNLLWSVTGLDADTRKSKASRLAELAIAFDGGATTQALRFAPAFARSLSAVLPREEFEPIRAAMAAEVERRRAQAQGDDPNANPNAGQDADKQTMTRVLAALQGAALRGVLIDHPAPPMTFRTVFAAGGAQPWTTLEDLKGKVVVLDFWTTWCGPCVGSFPQIKELRAAYAPSEVEIVGVTSLQGFVMQKGKGRVDCTGDPAKEVAALREFLTAMEVTWTAAISEEDVFNPDFGIDGIPFVAIIDRAGRVARAGLHPMNHDEITSIIDRLLRDSTPSDAGTTTANEGRAP